MDILPPRLIRALLQADGLLGTTAVLAKRVSGPYSAGLGWQRVWGEPLPAPAYRSWRAGRVRGRWIPAAGASPRASLAHARIPAYEERTVC